MEQTVPLLVKVLGGLNFLLLSLQLVSGLRFVSVPMGVHKKTGILLFVSAMAHAVLAVAAGSG